MGLGSSKEESKPDQKQQNGSSNIKLDVAISTHGSPIPESESKALYSNKVSMCKIKYKIKKGKELVNKSGTGFFCEINDDSIPFKKALFTNNHVLNETKLQIGGEIEFEYLKEMKKIKITKDRRTFTRKDDKLGMDYTCIEIFDADEIKNFFGIDKTIFGNKNILKKQEIFVLQYPKGGELSFDHGIIIDIGDNQIKHSVSTLEGSSGSPIIKRYNNTLVLGIHFGGENDGRCNYATPFDIIIKDIKNKLLSDSKIKEYRKNINLIYCKISNDSNPNNIFGKEFVEINKDNIRLIINGKQSKLVSEYHLKEGENNIQIIIDNKLTNLEYMFSECKSLNNIEELKYLNTMEVNNFQYMFQGCSSISDIKALENWNVSKGNNFSFMFSGCTSMSDINILKKWDVSNGSNFHGLFYGCTSISDINALEKWNVSNGNDFSYIFSGCKSLRDIRALENWNVSNGSNFSGIFSGCSLISDIKALKNWDVSNGINFYRMFSRCSSISDISALENWDVSNGNNFSYMFQGCSSLSDVNALQNWDVSNGNNFSYMFQGCSTLSEVNALDNWNVSSGNNFSKMFSECSSLSEINALENWNASIKDFFSSMF